MTELVHLDVAAGVATITLDSPANRNALSAQLRRELLGHLDTALADDAVRVVVLGHTGRVFCSGMDLKESRGAGAADQGVNEVPTILQRIWTAPKPVVAQVGGPTRAGGVGLVAACDIAVAADGGHVRVQRGADRRGPGGDLGDRAAPAAAARRARAVPHRRDVRRGARRRRSGWSTRGARRTSSTTRWRATSACCGSARPARSRRPRRCCARERPAAMADQFAEMLTLSARFFAGEEGQEGMRAFAEKRPPRWAG